MLNPSGQSIAGGRSESAMLNPMRPNPGPGRGPASFLGENHGQKPEYIIQCPPPETPAQVIQRHHDGIVHKNPSAIAVPAPPLPWPVTLGGDVIRAQVANQFPPCATVSWDNGCGQSMDRKRDAMASGTTDPPWHRL